MPPKIHSRGAGRDAGRRRGQHPHVEGVREAAAGNRDLVGQEVQRHEADDHERRAEQRVEEELHRRVAALLAAPHADHEVHRQQDDLEEDEEEDEVLGAEGADHARLEDEDQDQERLGVLRLREVVPGVDDAQRHDEQREGDQRQRDAVDADDVAAVDERDPRLVDDELEGAAVVVVEVGEQQDPHESHDEARGQRDDLVEVLLGLGDDEHHDGAQRPGRTSRGSGPSCSGSLSSGWSWAPRRRTREHRRGRPHRRRGVAAYCCTLPVCMRRRNWPDSSDASPEPFTTPSTTLVDVAVDARPTPSWTPGGAVDDAVDHVLVEPVGGPGEGPLRVGGDDVGVEGVEVVLVLEERVPGPGGARCGG